MKCPQCSGRIGRQDDACPNCGFKVSSIEAEPQSPVSVLRTSTVAKAILLFFVTLFSIAFLGLLIYNAYFWYDSWRTDQVYESGELMAPEVEEITLADGRIGHALTFYGRDGDEIFIPQLNRSYLFVGGLTRIEVADSAWFGLSPEDQEGAIITMMPQIYTDGGDVVQLPAMELDIPVPVSPLQVLNPPTDYTTVVTSMFNLQLKVVPGSTVLVNAEDVSTFVNFEGILEEPINIYPEGDNNISLFVSTPNHKQLRKDIVIHRAPQTINLEPSMNLAKNTTKTNFTVSGTTEPGATIVVDSLFVDGSVKVKPTGDFSFKAKLNTVGENVITFHAQMAGREDQYISISVNYTPPLKQYTDKAWAMDYEQLAKMTDIWEGRVFLCSGPVVEYLPDTDPVQFVVDVAKADSLEPQYVVIDNASGTTPIVGQRYRVYADVSGTQFYADKRVPKLVARYILNPTN